MLHKEKHQYCRKPILVLKNFMNLNNLHKSITINKKTNIQITVSCMDAFGSNFNGATWLYKFTAKKLLVWYWKNENPEIHIGVEYIHKMHSVVRCLIIQGLLPTLHWKQLMEQHVSSNTLLANWQLCLKTAIQKFNVYNVYMMQHIKVICTITLSTENMLTRYHMDSKQSKTSTNIDFKMVKQLN